MMKRRLVELAAGLAVLALMIYARSVEFPASAQIITYNPPQTLLATITLTDAQIRTVNSPVTVVAAPGAGQLLVPVSVTFDLNATAGAYGNINQEDFGLWWEPASVLTTTTAITEGLTVADRTLTSLLVVARLTGLASAIGNNSLAVQATNNGFGNYTGGNAANTLKVTVNYVVFGF